MPLDILLILVVAGIAGVALLLHLLGLSKPHVIADEAEAQAHWLEEFPDHPAQHITLEVNHQAALVRFDGGKGVIWPMGQDVAARMIDPARARLRETARYLVIDTHDFTAPHIRLRLGKEERRVWRAALTEETG